jgi:hypothetical protein
MSNIIGIDVGSKKSGVAIVTNGAIEKGLVIHNDNLCKLVCDKKYRHHKIVIEDLRAYSTRLSQDLITTAKFIGRLELILQQQGFDPLLVERVKIKKMVYDKYPSAQQEVVDKIRQRKKINSKGEFRKPSFIYVCDRVVANAMRFFWDLPQGQGKRNKLGLASHSWQALALCSYLLFSDSE